MTDKDQHGQSIYSITRVHISKFFDISDSGNNNEFGHFCACLAYGPTVSNYNYTKNFVNSYAFHCNANFHDEQSNLSYIIVAENKIYLRVFDSRSNSHLIKFVIICKNEMASKTDGLVSANEEGIAEYHNCAIIRNNVPAGSALFICDDISNISVYDSSLQHGYYNSSVVKISMTYFYFEEYYLYAAGCIQSCINNQYYHFDFSYIFIFILFVIS